MARRSERLERRKTQRVEWNSPGRIRFHGSRKTCACIIHNLSNAGARITAAKVAELPETFTLELLPEGRLRECAVVWRTPTELGVAFSAGALSVAKPLAKRAQVTG
jgi:hypothetical protein